MHGYFGENIRIFRKKTDFPKKNVYFKGKIRIFQGENPDISGENSGYFRGKIPDILGENSGYSGKKTDFSE